MFGIAANHPQDPLALNNLATMTDPSDGRFYFHCSAPYVAVTIFYRLRKNQSILFIPESDAASVRS
jgi:hypothetical protein